MQEQPSAGDEGWLARSRFGCALAEAKGAILVLGGLLGPKSDVWRSTDGGLGWEKTADVASWPARWGHGVVPLPSGDVILAGGMGSNGSELNDVWRSADDGATWQKLCDAAGWSARAGHSMVALPGGSATCLLLGGLDAAKVGLRDVWRSCDGGATWERLAGPAPWPGRCWSAAAALPGGLVLLLGGAGAEGALGDVWRSRDGGASWELLLEAAPWPARQGHCAAALPGGAVLVLGGLAAPGAALNDVWRSADGGASWERLAASAAWRRRADFGLVVRAGGALLLLGGAGGGGGALGDAWESHDGGAAWSRLDPRARPAARSGGGGERPPPPPPPVQERRAPGGISPPQAPARSSGPQAQAPDDATSRSLRFEEMPREHLRRAILDLQQGLSDLTQRLDGVAEENSALREENAMLKDAIDERIEGDRPGRRPGPSSAWAAED